MIAEIGVNHNGDMKLAKEMIVAAKKAGADAVKFQTFTAEKLVTQGTPKVDYQKSTTSTDESHFDMIKKLELGKEEHFMLKEYCDGLDIDFMSTPYDIESVDFLEELGVTQYKTASADLVDLPLHHRIAKTRKPVMVSVGMATMDEIEETLNIYKQYDHRDIVLLHCVSNYPCSLESLNLRVLTTLQKTFSCPIGYSDHSVANTAAVVSTALGAAVIEKHFTLDRSLPGPDHKASSTAEEFSLLVKDIRDAESALGKAVKQCQEEEEKMHQVSRKSVTLARTIAAGETIQETDLMMMRPGLGLPARDIPHIIGKQAKSELLKNYQLSWNDLNGTK